MFMRQRRRHTGLMRGNIHRVSVVAALVAATVALSVPPAYGHGENDARPLTRGDHLGPYVVSVWQVIGDHSSDLPSHMILTFDGVTPASGDQLTITIADSEVQLVARRLDATSWETTATVPFGAQFTVGLVTSNGEWMSSPIEAPFPPSESLPMRPLMSVALFITTAMAVWLGGRTKRAWTKHPAAVVATG